MFQKKTLHGFKLQFTNDDVRNRVNDSEANLMSFEEFNGSSIKTRVWFLMLLLLSCLLSEVLS